MSLLVALVNCIDYNSSNFQEYSQDFLPFLSWRKDQVQTVEALLFLEGILTTRKLKEG